MDADKLKERIKAFCRYLRVHRGLRKYTIEIYGRIVSKVLRDIETLELSQDQVEDYVYAMYEREYSSHHISNTSLAIEAYGAFTERPIKLGRPKKIMKIVKSVMSEAEVAILLASTKNIREKAIIALLAYSGVRNKELCHVKVQDVDFGSNRVRIINGKGGKSRVVCIAGVCTTILIQYLAEYPRRDDEYLFTTLRKNERYTDWALRRLVKKVGGLAGINKRVHPHLFRHSLASNLLNRGANLRSVQEQLGHSFIQTTMIYITSGFGQLQKEYDHFTPGYL